MIIKGERVITTRAAGPLVAHLLHGEENDAVAMVQGTEADIRSAFADARALGRKFALRHFIISPAVETSRADAMMVLGLLAREFTFELETAIVVEHAKPRVAGAGAFGAHWHALVPEQDLATGRQTLSSKFSYLRNDKVARLAENRLGHPLVKSAHATAVIKALEYDGEIELAARLQEAADKDPSPRPRAAFSFKVHQMGKRLGADIPAARAAVRAAWETTNSQAAFAGALEESQLLIRAGDKPSTFIVETVDGVFVGAAHRLARVRKSDLLARMKGDQNVRTHDSTNKRETVSRSTAIGDTSDKTAPRPTGSARSVDRRRPGPDVATVDSSESPRPADKQRSAASEDRRYRSLRARSSARRFGEQLNRSPRHLQKLVEGAAKIAIPPGQRVANALVRYEEHLEGRLEALRSRPPPSAAMGAARQNAKIYAFASTNMKRPSQVHRHVIRYFWGTSHMD